MRGYSPTSEADEISDRFKNLNVRMHRPRRNSRWTNRLWGQKAPCPSYDSMLNPNLKENPEYLPKDPIEILTKAPPPAPASNDRYYAVWQRFGDVFGSLGRINIWNTTGPVDGEASIAQVAVIRGDPMQAIESEKLSMLPLRLPNGRPFLPSVRPETASSTRFPH